MAQQRSLAAGVSVRAGRAADVGAAIRLFRASVHRLAARHYTPAQCRAWAPEVIDAELWLSRWATRQVWMAVDADGALAGFAEAEADGHLDMLYVDPAAAGQGVASLLLAAIEAATRAAGRRCLYTEASVTAVPFFERRGFQVITPRTVLRRGVSFRNYRMQKALEPAE